MKIIHLLSDTTAGPAVRMAADLCRAAVADGQSAMVMCRNSKTVAGLLDEAGIERVVAPLKGVIDVISPVRLSKILRDSPEGRTVVHVHRLADAIVASRARTLASRPDVKILFTRHILAPGPVDPATERLYGEIDAIAFPTQTALKEFVASNPKIEGERLSIISSATLLPDHHEGPVEVPDNDVLTVVTAGKITAEKGIDTLVVALAAMRGRKLRVVVSGQGRGSVVMPVIRLARRLGVADLIDWKGETKSLEELLGSADVLLFPDKSVRIQGEEYSIALASGLPVVASDIALHREIFGGKATYFAAGNSNALSAALAAVGGEGCGGVDFNEFAQAYKTLYLKLLQ